MILGAAVRLREWRHDAAFRHAIENPAEAQAAVLRRLLAANAGTAFGREHGFTASLSPKGYARAVPLRDYEGFRPYVRRIDAGEPAVLTADPVILFATTSGTTSEPKWVPVTAAWKQQMAALTRLWTRRVCLAHPAAFHQRILFLASPAFEGRTPNGFPLGAMTGVIQERLPWILRRHYALPPVLNMVADPDTRYFILIRLSLERRLSIACTPNPSSFLRLGQVAGPNTERLIRAVHDGTLGIEIEKTYPGRDRGEIVGTLKAAAHADPARARELEGIVAEHRGFSVPHCWPDLRLIGCWLGGSAGFHGKRLAEDVGPTIALRDLGLVASEGRVSIPLDDGTPDGVLAVHANFYEFIPEEAMDGAQPETVLAHELEDGKRYGVVLSGGNGLYRYDLNDVVEVHGFHGRTPRVRFARKGRDMVNITGEKLHLNHVQAALRHAEGETGLRVWQFRLIPDVARSRYDLLVEPHQRQEVTGMIAAFGAAFDAHLAVVNPEYAAKRQSKRLHPPVIFVMKPGWSERASRTDFASGKRELQYKWPPIRHEWDEATRAEILQPPAEATGTGQ